MLGLKKELKIPKQRGRVKRSLKKSLHVLWDLSAIIPTCSVELSWIKWEEIYPLDREREICLFMFSIKRKIRQFQVIIVQWRQRNVSKGVLHVKRCCFANLNLSEASGFCCLARESRSLFARRASEVFWEFNRNSSHAFSKLPCATVLHWTTKILVAMLLCRKRKLIAGDQRSPQSKSQICYYAWVAGM